MADGRVAHRRKDFDIELARSLVDYDPVTGRFTWRARPYEMFQHCAKPLHAWSAWNGLHAGREAFTSCDLKGYRQGKLLGQSVSPHRLAWAMTNGSWPVDEIDHINWVRDDNRLCNLRPATRHQNMANRPGKNGFTSQFLGVCRRKRDKRWCAKIQTKQGPREIGYFESEVEAAKAYNQAALAAFGEFASLNPV